MSTRETLVPLHAWAYHAPKLAREGRLVDPGLVAEALVYYDKVYVSPENDDQFAQYVSWFHQQRRLSDLVTLIKEGAITVYYHAFLPLPLYDDRTDSWSLWTVQDTEAAEQAVFETRIVNSPKLRKLLGHRRHSHLANALVDHHVEVKASEFGPAIKNATADFSDPYHSAFLLQILLDEVYRDAGFPRPPQVETTVRELPGRQQMTFNVDLDDLRARLGPKIGFHRGSPLAAAGFGTMILWAAAKLKTDLYLASPMTAYAHFKLEEGNRAARRRTIIDKLVAEVEFPDVRRLVNAGEIGIGAVLELRKHAGKFREWLADESLRDRNAAIYYHQEIARRAGWTRNSSKVLSIASFVGGPALGAGLGTALGGPLGAIPGVLAGSVVGSAGQYLLDLASRMGQGWKPVVFGQWASETLDRARRDFTEKADS